MPVGFNLAMSDDQPAPTDSHLAEKRADVYGPWLEAAKSCDGVQTYSRAIVGKKDLPIPKGTELTQVGWEFYPECVEGIVAVDRSTQRRTIKPSATYLGNIARNNSL
jgi:beta-glucosidase